MVKRTSVAIFLAALLMACLASVAVAATITGTRGDDFLAGTNNADTISARAGDDVVRGRDGGDDIEGGIGIDELYGVRGADEVTAGDGRDRLDGGRGNDTLRAAGDRDSDSVTCGPGEGDTAFVSTVDVIDGQQVGTTPESVLENGTTCENIEIVLFD